MEQETKRRHKEKGRKQRSQKKETVRSQKPEEINRQRGHQHTEEKAIKRAAEGRRRLKKTGNLNRRKAKL